jgi:AcrR family transcriptional regulator
MREDGRRRNARAPSEVIRERIAAAANEIVRQQGLSALTMMALGRALHMRPATLERFVRDIEEVADTVTVTAQAELIELIEAAIRGQAGPEVLKLLFEAQRLYAQAQPRMYQAAIRRPAYATVIEPCVSDALTRVECAALQACGAPRRDAERLAWCLRAAIHGAISLEASDRWTRQHQIDQNFGRLVSLLAAAAQSTAAGSASRGYLRIPEQATSKGA